MTYFPFPGKNNLIDELQEIPKAIKNLDVTDLSRRFSRLFTRVEAGRKNEMMFYEMRGIFPSNFSQLIGTKEVHYRYVSVSIQNG